MHMQAFFSLTASGIAVAAHMKTLVACVMTTHPMIASSTAMASLVVLTYPTALAYAMGRHGWTSAAPATSILGTTANKTATASGEDLWLPTVPGSASVLLWRITAGFATTTPQMTVCKTALECGAVMRL